MKSSRIRTLSFVLIALAVLLVPGMAMAVGTTSGTSVGNSAQLSYTVGAGPAITPVPATTSFLVDLKVIFSVANQDAGKIVSVAAGQVGACLEYDILNDSNNDNAGGFENLSFALQAEKVAGAGAGGAAGIPAPVIWIDGGDNTCGGDDVAYVPANGITIASGDPAGVTQKVFLVVTIPAAAGGSTDDFHLVARAVDFNDTTTPKAETGLADVPGTVEVVFADGTGTLIFGGGADADENGYHSDIGTFSVGSAIITFTKIQDVVWDPYELNGGNQKAIPGAYIEYTVTVANDTLATASASLTSIVDTMTVASDVTLQNYVSDLGAWTVQANPIQVTCTIQAPDTRPSCDSGATYYAGAFVGNDLTLTMTTLLPGEGVGPLAAGELSPGDTVVIKYMVSVN